MDFKKITLTEEKLKLLHAVGFHLQDVFWNDGEEIRDCLGPRTVMKDIMKEPL
jgi:hypothetical protein